MASDSQKKIFLILTVFISFIAVGLTVAAFATDSWIKYSGRNLNETSTNSTIAVGQFGLFRGDGMINYGFGDRPRISEVICSGGWCTYYTIQTTSTVDKIDSRMGKEYLDTLVSNFTTAQESGAEDWEYGLFRMGYWVSVLVMLSLGIVWGLVSIGFTAFNIFGKPIETITGPLGLYIWNCCAVICSLIGVILFVVLYQTNFANNVLPYSDYHVSSFRTKDNTSLDYSFYLTLGSLCGYIINIVLMMFSGYKVRCLCMQEADKAMDNGIILY